MSHVQDRPGHDRRYAIDAAKMHNLGWQPLYPQGKFEDGLRKTVEWYQANAEWVNEVRKKKDEINPHIEFSK